MEIELRFPVSPSRPPLFLSPGWAGSVFFSPSLQPLSEGFSLCLLHLTLSSSPKCVTGDGHSCVLAGPWWILLLKQVKWQLKLATQTAIQAQFNQMLCGCASNQAFDLVLKSSSSQGDPPLVHGGNPCPAPHQASSSPRDFPSPPSHSTGYFRSTKQITAHPGKLSSPVWNHGIRPSLSLGKTLWDRQTQLLTHLCQIHH